MEIVVSQDGQEYEVRLHLRDADAPLSTLLPNGDGAESWVVDGHPVASTTPIRDAGLLSGSVVHMLENVSDPLADSGDRGPASTADAPADGRIPFHRAPRFDSDDLPPPPSVPDAPAEVTSSIRISWPAVAVPVVLGLVMATLFHPRMALFALFSPLMLLVNWLEDRRRMRRSRRRGRIQLSRSTSRFRTELRAYVEMEVGRRRRAHPHPDTLAGVAATGHATLWQRRRHHADAMAVALGTGCTTWDLPVASSIRTRVPNAETVTPALHDVPIPLVLLPGIVLGIVGERSQALGLVRSLLLQCAVLHGPADLQIAVITDAPRDWAWVKWLPHTLIDHATGSRRCAGDTGETQAMLDSLSGSDSAEAPVRLAVVDRSAPEAYSGSMRRTLRHSTGGGLAAIVVSDAIARLPDACNAFADVGNDGVARFTIAATGEPVDGVATWRVGQREAGQVARSLARFSDPDLEEPEGRMAERVSLLFMLDLDRCSPDAVLRRWKAAPRGVISTPIGLGATGPIHFDIARDGPHGLIAGTTGAGKSEMLRTIVAGLAASASPEHITFVLIDYKGGSAFDACASLPHTVGLVTDLDGRLARRALAFLEAELKHRERVLRVAGAGDLEEYIEAGVNAPLPRLVILVDELAALSKEVPGFVAGLVDIAQRGRSLGVHLIVATQRPAGVVSESIQANIDLRVALRVQHSADSIAVVGVPDAASISRSRPGRAYLRVGAGDAEVLQCAVLGRLSQAPTNAISPFAFAMEQPEPPPAEVDQDVPTDLERLVSAVTEAAEAAGTGPPRRPWPEPLPETVELSELIASSANSTLAPFALADDPVQQRQEPYAWSPGEGNLMLYGLAGSGTSTALASIAIGLCRTSRPDSMHLYILDCDDHVLAPFAEVPHVGAVVTTGERERQLRLLRFLSSEMVTRRRSNGAGDAVRPQIVVLVDNFARLWAGIAEPLHADLRDELVRIIGDGPSVGIHTIATAKQAADVPSAVASLIPGRIGLRLADRFELSAIGVGAGDMPSAPGRALAGREGVEIQIALPNRDGLGAAVESMLPSPYERTAPPVMTLGHEVKVADIIEWGALGGDVWRLPIGVSDRDLRPVGFEMTVGRHVLVAGRVRSGKSTTLATIAQVAAELRPNLRIVALAPRPSPLREVPHVERVCTDEAAFERLLKAHLSPGLVLVDDAESLDDATGAFAALIGERNEHLHVIAAGDGDLLRSAYVPWLQEIKRARLGIALQADGAGEGDLWQARFPVRTDVQWPPGRGYLIGEGEPQLVQVAVG